jgi:hypothetical protein
MFKNRKTSELTGAALDWAVSKAEGFDADALVQLSRRVPGKDSGFFLSKYSTDWAKGGPIIEREDISVIRLEDESIPDNKGFWQGKYLVQWGAVIGDRHSAEEQYGSQGDYWGLSYNVNEGAVIGHTPLITAMRCYVASKLGDIVKIPEELE